MPPLAALLVATPVFGLSLTVDPAYLPAQGPQMAPTMAALDTPMSVDAGLDIALTTEDGAPDIGEEIARRQRLGRVHRAMGISTWVGMTWATIFGIIQYRNLYGAFDGRDSNPCARGDATLGQSTCSGIPGPHLATVCC